MYKIYNVVSGDTIYTVADKLGVTPEEVKRLNGLADNTQLTEGMQIVVPANMGMPLVEYQIQKGDTIYELARRSNINYNDLLTLNGLNSNDYIYPGQIILLPKQGNQIYITKENDSLNEIIKKLGITPNDILNKNREIYLIPDQLIVYSKNE